jgi:hypothetical protein
VFVFQSQLIWKQAGNSALDAILGSADLTAQDSAKNSIGVVGRLFVKRELTGVHIAAEEGDHIARELTSHQGVCCGEYEPLVFAHAGIKFTHLFGHRLIPV